ncbi:MAG: hypothetical protein E4H00_02560 [Myxococcales bacterium]|nr:MAG: hypothetical protein E4H00_02560 [Myxococcales bacterium]
MRSLEDQPPGFAASDIHVSTTKLSFESEVAHFIVGGTSRRVTTFYFDSVGKMDITPKKKGHVVRVWDSSGVYRFRVVVPDPVRARRFMDAMFVMSHQPAREP